MDFREKKEKRGREELKRGIWILFRGNLKLLKFWYGRGGSRKKIKKSRKLMIFINSINILFFIKQ